MMRATKDDILVESERILSIMSTDELSQVQSERIIQDSLENFPLYVTEAILKSRKSYADQIGVAEWSDEGAIFRDTKGEEYIDCLGGYGAYALT